MSCTAVKTAKTISRRIAVAPFNPLTLPTPMRLFPSPVHVLFVVGLAWGCAGLGDAVEPAGGPIADGLVEVVIVQLNDVYEITPLAGGRQGGLARVGTLLRRLEAENPNTVAVMAGDFFGPSALGTAEVDGERLAGRQMVAALNALGLDYATFGNHEFDVEQQQFFRLLGEAEFAWVSSNVVGADSAALPGVWARRVFTAHDADGDSARVGLLGVTLNANEPPYVRIGDAVEAARDEAAALEGEADVVVALTHLTLAEDEALAGAVPTLDLVLGGHEHENVLIRRGPGLTPIAKADANARTVFVHRLVVETRTGRLAVDSDLVPVTDALTDDAAVAAEVGRWVEGAFAGFRRRGFEPDRVAAVVAEPLDGREASVRGQPTALTRALARALRREGAAEVALVNGGSVRIDDIVPAGPVSEYDVIRMLPFGGRVVTAEVRGQLLAEILAQGEANRGSGGYLHVDGAERAGDGWRVNGAPLEPGRLYRVALNDFLLTGRERGLGYLTPDHPDVEVVAEGRDVRLALLDELRRTYGAE